MRSHFVDAVCACGWREPLTVYGPPVLQAIAFACPRCSLRWRLVGGEDLVDGAWAADQPTAEPAAEPAGAWCPQCGPDASSDDDGCCSTCGAAAVGYGAEQALLFRRELDRWRGDHATDCTLLGRMATGTGPGECSCGWDEPDLRAIRARARAEALAEAAACVERRLDGSAQDYEVAQCAAAVRALAQHRKDG